MKGRAAARVPIHIGARLAEWVSMVRRDIVSSDVIKPEPQSRQSGCFGHDAHSCMDAIVGRVSGETAFRTPFLRLRF